MLTPCSETHFFFLCIAESPAGLEMLDKAEELEIGKLTKVEFLMLNVAHNYVLIKGNP